MFKTDSEVVIVGGGPAGMMAGLLLARAGVDVMVLEKHADFFRDFRGDTVHPSTMEALHDIGLLDRFLEKPHNRLDGAGIRLAGREWQIGDFTGLDTPAPFIAMMPQWDFLDFLREEAVKYKGFALAMEAKVVELIERNDRVSGVVLADGHEVNARRLVIMTDGRDSLVRKRELLPVRELGAPMDVLWFRLAKEGDQGDRLLGSIDTGRMVVLIDRGTYWQTAYLIPKGKGVEIKAKGVPWILGQVREAFPDINFPEDGGPNSPDELRLLNVTLDRLECWYLPGLLAIGDAAHAMSPIGGVGINLAIQDAVATANLLASPLANGEDVDGLLAAVQDRRMLPTRIIQFGQKLAQDNIITRVLSDQPITRAPLPVRLLDRFPILRRIPGRIIGLGVRRETVNTES